MSDSDFPQLTTDRLRLEPFELGHSAGIFRLWSSPEVCLHSRDACDRQGRPIRLPARSPTDSDKILDFFVRRAQTGTGVRWAVLLARSLTAEDDGCIGAVGLNALSPVAELAYHFHPDHWGAGYAEEACAAVLRWCRQDRPGIEIEAFIEAGNIASARLARRLGFEPTPESRDGADRYVLRGEADPS